MDIDEYLKIDWEPVSELDYDLDPVSAGLYRFKPNWYLGAVPFDRNMEGDSEHITQVVWAQSDGAARRIWDMSIESDEVLEAQFPSELSLGLSLPTYANLLTALSTKYPGQTMESASYRIATDGKFVKKTISADNYEFYFRCNEDNPFELPFAASYSNRTNS
jgi:hypothetical protein